MYRPIRDYAIIGNLRSAALVGKDGSIDWAPAPFIDSPSVFASILDHEKGGYFKIAPTSPHESRQFYIEDTNVVVTEFTTETGVVQVTDFIPIEAEKSFMPEEQETTFKIKRKVACISGEAEMHVEFMPRFDYARGTTELSFISRGILAHNAGKRGILVTRRAFKLDEERNVASHSMRMREGDTEFFVFRYNSGEVDIRKDSTVHHEEELVRTIHEWRAWVARPEIEDQPTEGKWRNEIVRSALLLKILFFEPIGTIAAAPTTSLPEWIGGERNWDYRYTWVRDSAFVFNAFFKLGHLKEAEEYLNWLVNLCALADPKDLQIMYTLRGSTELAEETLTHLEGYRGSAPVRIGNGAYRQQQWDIYGGIMDVAHQLAGHTPSTLTQAGERWGVLRALADHVATIWREPDEGLWEVRNGKRHFVYSKVMCWVALDRAIALASEHALEGTVDLWMQERECVRTEIMERGFNTERNTFVQSFDSTELDAALLLLPRTGFIDGADPKMLGTIRAIEEKLLCGEGLLYRYTEADGIEGAEGAFLPASFWLVQAYAYAGALDKAEALFESVLTLGNHVGLYPEEIDPGTGEFLGNFPQAYTHIGLINSALLLRSCLQGACEPVDVVE